MIKTKKRIALILAVVFALGALSACDGEVENPAQSATTTSNTLDDDIVNPVDISEIELENKDELENPNITYYGFYDMRVAGDIKPAVKLFEETYGGTVDYYEVTWGERVEKLTTLIVSGDSPDLVDKESNSFPHLMSKNIYEDLTDYIDLSLPQWSGMTELIESYTWNGAKYFYPFAPEASPNWLIYNQTTFEELGLDDPRELYDNNAWDWNSFKSVMVDFMNKAPDAICGYYGLPGLDFMLTTGKPLIGVENGVLTNNMKDASIERAAVFLEELRKEGLTYFGEGMWSNEMPALINGQAAFMGVGIWRFTDLKKASERSGGNVEFGLVPYPRDPSADAYYMGVSAFGYLVPKGSSNVEGAAAFINIVRMTKTDPELMEITKESIMTSKLYSEEEYDFITSFYDIDKFNTVNDASAGFTQDINDIITTMINNITFSQNEEASSWTQLRSQYEYLIDEAVNSFN